MATLAWHQVEPQVVPVQEYLHTSYQPDCDYVDGHVEQRNLGEHEHSQIQTILTILCGIHQRQWNVSVLVECRLQVRPDRFRVPDVMILRKSQKVTRIVQEAPLVCMEVLSPEDTWAKMRVRLNDYLALGVGHIWCFDPEAREVRRYDSDGFNVVTSADLTVAGTPIRLVVAEVVAALDEDTA